MIKRLKNNEPMKKILIILLISIFLITFILPTYSQADAMLGKLGGAITDLIRGIGDAIENIMQDIMLPGSPKAIEKRSIMDVQAAKDRQDGHPIKADIKEAAGDVGNILFNNKVVKWVSNSTVGRFVASTVTAAGAGTISGLLTWGTNKYVLPWVQEYTDKKTIPLIIYGPAAIFSNMVPALDVNFINPSVTYTGGENVFDLAEDEHSLTGWRIVYKYKKDTKTTDEEKMQQNTAYQLRGTIATWYVALRNLALVGLLSVLVYVGIRIIISSTAGETARYKSMLKDWLMAMCILFFLHYMMAFALRITDLVTDILSDNVVQNVSADSNVEVKGDIFMNNTRILAEFAKKDTEDDLSEGSSEVENGNEEINTDAAESNGDEEEDEEVVDEGEDDSLTQFGYTITYWVLIFYTLIFTWKYLKRLIYLAFLTMIAPLIALTYPIDKMKDGSAQAFNMWFREYIFNILIQPIHLLLYTILISTAMDFAEKNIVYTIVALGFMLEAEKIVKALFGFKAQGGEAKGMVTGAAMFAAASGVLKSGAKLIGGSSSGKSGGDKVRTADSGQNGGIEGRSNLRESFGLNNNENSSGQLQEADVNSGIVLPPLPNQEDPNGFGREYSIEEGNIEPPQIPNIEIPNNNNVETYRPSRISGIARAGKYIGGKVVNKDNAKKAIKMAAIGTGAAALGSIGLAAGIASDSSDDVLKGLGAGLGVGKMAGEAGYNLAERTKDGAKELRDQYQQGKYGEEYKNIEKNAEVKEWIKSNTDAYKKKYGKEWEKNINKDSEFVKHGIKDKEAINVLHSMREKHGDAYSAQQLTDVYKEFNKYSADTLADQGKTEEIKRSISRKTGNPGRTDEILTLGRETKGM